MCDRLRGQSGRTSQADCIVESDRATEDQRHGERRISGRADDNARHRLIALKCISCAHRGLTIAEWIPREPNTGLPILVVLVVNVIDVSTDPNQRGGQRIESNEAVVTLGGRHVPLITKTEFERECWPHPVAVLHKKPERTFGYAARLTTKRDAEGIRGARNERA